MQKNASAELFNARNFKNILYIIAYIKFYLNFVRIQVNYNQTVVVALTMIYVNPCKLSFSWETAETTNFKTKIFKSLVVKVMCTQCITRDVRLVHPCDACLK